MIETILAWGGGIVLIGNVGAVIYKIIKPSIDIRKEVDRLERHDKQDLEKIQNLEELNKAQCKMLLAMIDHMIDGNHVDKMKETRERIIELFTDIWRL